jgi:hypothetical protein
MASLSSAPFGPDLDQRTAVAEAETPSPHRWVELSAYAEQKIEQVESPHIAEQLIRRELDLGLPCRYVEVGDVDVASTPSCRPDITGERLRSTWPFRRRSGLSEWSPTHPTAITWKPRRRFISHRTDFSN